MTALVGDDALVDEEFWKMDLFKEDEEDEEYKSEAGINHQYDFTFIVNNIKLIIYKFY